MFLVTTIVGITGLWPAILADTGATVLVTANAMRLLGVRLRLRPVVPDLAGWLIGHLDGDGAAMRPIPNVRATRSPSVLDASLVPGSCRGDVTGGG